MSQIYELVSFGTSPVTLADMKTWLKFSGVTLPAAEDTLIQALIDTATEWGEKYTGREFRANQWKLLIDGFNDIGNSSERFQRNHLSTVSVLPFAHPHHGRRSGNDRIELKRDPVDLIDSVKHLVSATLVTVPNTDYYLKKNTQSSEILLFENKTWPSDTDNREQAIEITFTTKIYRCTNEIKNTIKLHVANLYSNRGDCPDSRQAARESGATMIYDQFRISRV